VEERPKEGKKKSEPNLLFLLGLREEGERKRAAL